MSDELTTLRAKVKAQGDYIRKLRGEYRAMSEQFESRLAGYRNRVRKLRAELSAATADERSCAFCPEMVNPDGYISHLQSALKWHDEHVPRPTNPRNTCVVLEGENPPEEVMFVVEGGSTTHYLPEGAGTCRAVLDEGYYKGINGVCEGLYCSKCNEPLSRRFKHCPWCGRKIKED